MHLAGMARCMWGGGGGGGAGQDKPAWEEDGPTTTGGRAERWRDSRCAGTQAGDNRRGADGAPGRGLRCRRISSKFYISVER